MDYRAGNNIEDEPTFLFSRWNDGRSKLNRLADNIQNLTFTHQRHIAMRARDALAQKYKLRLIIPDNFGYGGTEVVPPEHGIKAWLGR